MEDQNKLIHEVTQRDYRFGFVTDIETDTIVKGLNEEVVRIISAKKEEPEFMLEFRLKAYRRWLTMKMPEWAQLKIPEIDYQEIIFYAAPSQQAKYESLNEVDPELLRTFEKLGIPLEEQKMLSGVAVDAVIDSVSVKTTFKETLTWSRNTLGCPCPITTISLLHLILPFFLTDRSFIYRKGPVARWNCQLISGSMPGTRVSSNVP
jgi:Fe-S cluster assembly protein SufB